MPLHLTEEEFKKKGLELFSKLEQDSKNLEDVHAAFEQSLKLIGEGKQLFNQGNSADSLIKYNEASGVIKGAISRRSEPMARNLLLVELAYLVFILLLGYFTLKWPDFALWKGIISQPLQTAWFGALGGITIAIYGIYSHIQRGDFDPNYKLWYLCKPIMGAIFGWFVYLIFFLGMVSIQGVNQDKLQRPELAFLIAFLAGFSERFTIQMIDKLMSVLTTWEGREALPK